jgi:hypothetical protein
MRWDRLFADLEARFEEIEDAQAAAELADRERVAVGAVLMIARLAGSLDQSVRLRLAGSALVTGTLRSVGPDWLLVVDGQGRESVIALAGITAVEGLRSSTGPEPGGLALRLDLRRALRGLVRDRAPVAVGLVGSGGAATTDVGSFAAAGTSEIVGTIDRVGADFIEVAVHAAWEPRRAGAVRSVVLVPIAAILLVRALPLG